MVTILSKFTQSTGFDSFYIGKGLLTLGTVVSSLALSTIVSAFTGKVSISAGIPPLFAFFQLIKSHLYLLPPETRAFAADIAWKEPKREEKNEVEVGLQGNCGLQAF